MSVRRTPTIGLEEFGVADLNYGGFAAVRVAVPAERFEVEKHRGTESQGFAGLIRVQSANAEEMNLGRVGGTAGHPPSRENYRGSE